MNDFRYILLSLIVFCSLFFESKAQTNLSQLEGAFGKLRDNNTSQNQEAYFNAFPNTWPEFLDLCRALDSLDNQPQGVCDYWRLWEI